MRTVTRLPSCGSHCVVLQVLEDSDEDEESPDSQPPLPTRPARGASAPRRQQALDDSDDDEDAAPLAQVSAHATGTGAAPRSAAERSSSRSSAVDVLSLPQSRVQCSIDVPSCLCVFHSRWIRKQVLVNHLPCRSAEVPSKRAASTKVASASKKPRVNASATPAATDDSDAPQTAPAEDTGAMDVDDDTAIAAADNASGAPAAAVSADAAMATGANVHPEYGVPPDEDAVIVTIKGKPHWEWVNEKGEEVTKVRPSLHATCCLLRALCFSTLCCFLMLFVVSHLPAETFGLDLYVAA